MINLCKWENLHGPGKYKNRLQTTEANFFSETEQKLNKNS